MIIDGPKGVIHGSVYNIIGKDEVEEEMKISLLFRRLKRQFKSKFDYNIMQNNLLDTPFVVHRLELEIPNTSRSVLTYLMPM